MAQIATKVMGATVDRIARRTRLKLNDPFLPEPHKRLGRFFAFTSYLKKNIRLTKQTIPFARFGEFGGDRRRNQSAKEGQLWPTQLGGLSMSKPAAARC
ncbi:hypothetical protein ACXIUS_25730 [Bosea thiooxidans]|nr:hypothetical protein [Bosea sp. (in: a-proteobacteria)]